MGVSALVKADEVLHGLQEPAGNFFSRLAQELRAADATSLAVRGFSLSELLLDSFVDALAAGVGGLGAKNLGEGLELLAELLACNLAIELLLLGAEATLERRLFIVQICVLLRRPYVPVLGQLRLPPLDLLLRLHDVLHVFDRLPASCRLDRTVDDESRWLLLQLRFSLSAQREFQNFVLSFFIDLGMAALLQACSGDCLI